MDWSTEHTQLAILGFAVVSEAIGMSKLKSNSVLQALLVGIRALIKIKGKK